MTPISADREKTDLGVAVDTDGDTGSLSAVNSPAHLSVEPLPVALTDLGEPGGYRVWSASSGSRDSACEVRFVGRGPSEARRACAGEVLRAITGDPSLDAARVHQVHGAQVHAVDTPGLHSEGDAVYTRHPGLAVAVVTADCVPVLVQAGPWVAAIHAGWRGLVAGVVPRTLERLTEEEGAGSPSTWRAWIGPVNAACCYEVEDDVADQVAAATTSEAIVHFPPGTACGGSGDGRPHLDLVTAARHQLARAAIPTAWLPRCTHCDSDSLYSYRRNGKRAGRNFAFLWKPALTSS